MADPQPRDPTETKEFVASEMKDGHAKTEDEFVEPLEDERLERYFIEPDERKPVFRAYKKAVGNFWTEEEIDTELAKDPIKWAKMPSEVKDLVKHQLAYFLIGDGIINDVLEDSLASRITDREVKTWINYKKMAEDVHNLTYVKLVDAYITDPEERRKIFDGVNSYPALRKKVEWIRKWADLDNDFHRLPRVAQRDLRRLASLMSPRDDLTDEQKEFVGRTLEKIDEPQPPLALPLFIEMVTEGLFFSGSFCIIFWVNHVFRGELPGLAMANEHISRDEGDHVDCDLGLYTNGLANKLPVEQAHLMMAEAVDIEIEFMNESLRNRRLSGLNIDLMAQYIRFIADGLLVDQGYPKIWSVACPFTFMIKQSIGVRITDFFVSPHVSEYSHPTANKTAEDQNLDFSEDF